MKFKGNCFIKFSKYSRLVLVTFLFLFLAVSNPLAQPIPTNDITENIYRVAQLLSDSTSPYSFSNRHLWFQQNSNSLDNIDIKRSPQWFKQLEPNSLLNERGIKAGFYHPILTNTYNSKLPYGGNNNSAWYGKGLNTEMISGVWITSDYFTFTLRPHFTYQQNRDFTTPRFISQDSEGNPRYESIVDNIDMPFRFGPDAFTTFDLGQSSFRLHYKSIEAGLSKENLWWGPGIQNALLLSNNAPGLKHTFLGSRDPVKLPLNIGHIEFKLIGAWPEDSKYFEEGNDGNQRRFTSGTNIVFSPSILPGLHLGFSRISHQFIPENGLGLSDFLSSISYGDRQTTGSDGKNQLISLHFRWVFPESGAEIYGEYFREDSFFDNRDLFLEPDHDRAYTIGGQKIIYSDWIDFFKVNAEISNLVPTRVDEVRPQAPYYRHFQITQGHTNGGQVLGAAIGPGSGSQYLGVEGYFDKGMLGMFIQRVEENDFFHYEYYDQPNSGTGLKDIWRHRVNLNIGLKSHYKQGSFLFSGKLVWNKNYNYGRYNLGDLDVDFDSVEKNDIVNIHLQLSARYLF